MHGFLEFVSCQADKSDLLEFLDENLSAEHEIVSMIVDTVYHTPYNPYTPHTRYHIFYRKKDV